MTEAVKFNATLAAKIFAAGESDEKNNKSDNVGEWLEQYRKFYAAGRAKMADALRPAREEAAKFQREIFREVLDTLSAL